MAAHVDDEPELAVCVVPGFFSREVRVVAACVAFVALKMMAFVALFLSAAGVSMPGFLFLFAPRWA